MSSIKFKEHLLTKGYMDIPIEDVFRAMAEYAGIHSLSFNSDFYDPFADTDFWDMESEEGTWSISAVSEIMVGAASTGWNFVVTDTYETPAAFILTSDAFGEFGSIGVLATDVDNLIYCWWSNQHVGITQRSSDADTILCRVPRWHSNDQKIMISVQPAISSDDCFISMWSNEKFMVNAHLGSYPTGRKLALGCFQTNVAGFDNLRVPELTEVLDVVTMDVGETPGGALQRAIGRRHINYFVRYDGTLRAWRPGPIESSDSLTLSDVDVLTEIVDRRGLVSHWRQVGAWDIADAWDTDLLESIGHRFHKDDNPDLLTQDDCETEAALSLARVKQYAHTLSMSAPMLPLIEPEDRITIAGQDWLVTDIAFSIAAGALIMTMTLREYIYGEP